MQAPVSSPATPVGFRCDGCGHEESGHVLRDHWASVPAGWWQTVAGDSHLLACSPYCAQSLDIAHNSPQKGNARAH